MILKKKLPRLYLFGIIVIILLIGTNIFLVSELRKTSRPEVSKVTHALTPDDIAKNAHPAPTSLPTPVPSPKPLTFDEMNSLYGPCTHLPVVFYHHIQNMDVAKAAGQQNLTVATNIFIDQMHYLKDHGYNPVATNSLTDFFDRGISLPSNPILLTFDDGYEDFYVNVLPILREIGFRALMALPTGLVGNPGYMTWDEVSQAASANIEFVNHTWSHANVAQANTSLDNREIDTAEDQLTQHGQNANKVFVYPYGTYDDYDINYLRGKGYTLAFSTEPGSIMCKAKRFALPRIRIGNASLAAYGF